MTRSLRFLLPLLLATTALAESADLSVTPTGQLRRDEREYSLLLAMVNNGPDVARQAVVTIDVPAGVEIETATLGSGNDFDTCDTSVRPVVCRAGDVHVGMPPHYGGMRLRLPVANAQYEIKVAVASDTPDPKPSNNSGSVSWQTRIEADLGVLIVPETDRTDPGGSGEFTVYVCNNVENNQAPAARVEFTSSNATVSGVAAATGFSCRADDPSRTVCTIPELPYGCPREPFHVSLRSHDDRRGGEASLTVSASGDIGEKNPADNVQTKSFSVYRWIAVTSVADSGPGSLREAITTANAECSPGPCRIVFEIPKPVPAEGYFTITPSDPLPSITADRVTLEGSRQTAFTGQTNPKGPEVAIDGRLARRGIRMLAPCEAVVEGLAIGNFADQGLWIGSGGVASCGNRPDRREVALNHLGMHPAEFLPWPNLRGLRLDFSTGVVVRQNVIAFNTYSGVWMWRGTGVTLDSNYIADNGASGIFVGPEAVSVAVNRNVIRNHPHMGVAAARGAKKVLIRGNSMRNNAGLGIDWGLDGVSPSDGDDHNAPTNAPVMLSAVSDPAGTSVTVTFAVKTAPLAPYQAYGAVDLFANSTPDGDGEELIGSSSYLAAGDGTFTFTLPGDHRGKWINATWTRFTEFSPAAVPGAIAAQQTFDDGRGETTSELSNSVLVQ